MAHVRKTTHSRKTGARNTARRKASTRRKRLNRRAAPKRWSQRVTQESDALDLKRGVFKLKDPRKIAASLKRSGGAQLASQDRRLSLGAVALVPGRQRR